MSSNSRIWPISLLDRSLDKVIRVSHQIIMTFFITCIDKLVHCQDYVLDKSEKCLLLGSGQVFIEALCHACVAIFGKTGFAIKLNERSVLREGACLL
jgi:hypothetical protein